MLAELTSLVAADLGEHEVLVHAVQRGARAVPGYDGAGLAPAEGGVAVCSTALAREVDAAQRATGQGPGPGAATTGRPVRWTSDGGGSPRFAGRVRALGVHAVLAVPLPGAGTLTLHACTPGALGDDAARAAQALAGPVATTVRNTRDLARARRAAARLERDLRARATVDQAVGVVMARTGASGPEALARLEADARARGREVGDVARDLLADAVRRARRRGHRDNADRTG